LLQASLTVNVLVWERSQLLLTTEPSDDVIVVVPQASVADADPNAPVIAVEVGLHPSVTVVYIPVNTGEVTSSLHVTVLVMVDVLPHASIAVNVLVWDLLQLPLTEPSDELIVGVAQASLAVAVPKAAVIAVEVGLQPNATVE
jgi:hypothetical protein